MSARPARFEATIAAMTQLRLVVVPPIEEALGIFKGINTADLREEEDEAR